MPRENILEGKTPRVKTGCGWLYITMNYQNGKLFEVFGKMGKAGGCAGSMSEAIGRLISLCLRNNIPVEKIIRQVRGLSCYRPAGLGDDKILSCSDAIAQMLEKEMREPRVSAPCLCSPPQEKQAPVDTFAGVNGTYSKDFRYEYPSITARKMEV